MPPGEKGTWEQLWSRGKVTAWGNGEASELSRGLTKQSFECQAVNPEELEEAYRALSSPLPLWGPSTSTPSPPPYQGDSISQRSWKGLLETTTLWN